MTIFTCGPACVGEPHSIRCAYRLHDRCPGTFSPDDVAKSTQEVLASGGAYPATGHVAVTREGVCGCACHRE